MIRDLVDEAVAAGARFEPACEIVGVDPRTVQRWKRRQGGLDGRRGPRRPPRTKLTAAERRKILEVVNRPEMRDLCPKQIVARLADRGVYLASESTIYRLLREEKQLARRGRAKAPVGRSRPRELVAAGRNKVWSWDITWLRSPVRGRFFYLYLVMDVWSRKIVGAAVHEEESADHAAALLASAAAKEGIEPGRLVIHSDNGSPMRGATLLVTLQALGIAWSFSRPSVKDDNPYSESLFRTAKYRPDYPEICFADIEEARAWVERFVHWYNEEHRHGAIRFVTPAERHRGEDAAILEHRKTVYEAARARHPRRWSRGIRDWSPIGAVTLNPAKTDAAARVA